MLNEEICVNLEADKNQTFKEENPDIESTNIEQTEIKHEKEIDEFELNKLKVSDPVQIINEDSPIKQDVIKEQLNLIENKEENPENKVENPVNENKLDVMEENLFIDNEIKNNEEVLNSIENSKDPNQLMSETTELKTINETLEQNSLINTSLPIEKTKDDNMNLEVQNKDKEHSIKDEDEDFGDFLEKKNELNADKIEVGENNENSRANDEEKQVTNQFINQELKIENVNLTEVNSKINEEILFDQPLVENTEENLKKTQLIDQPSEIEKKSCTNDEENFPNIIKENEDIIISNEENANKSLNYDKKLVQDMDFNSAEIIDNISNEKKLGKDSENTNIDHNQKNEEDINECLNFGNTNEEEVVNENISEIAQKNQFEIPKIHEDVEETHEVVKEMDCQIQTHEKKDEEEDDDGFGEFTCEKNENKQLVNNNEFTSEDTKNEDKNEEITNFEKKEDLFSSEVQKDFAPDPEEKNDDVINKQNEDEDEEEEFGDFEGENIQTQEIREEISNPNPDILKEDDKSKKSDHDDNDEFGEYNENEENKNNFNEKVIKENEEIVIADQIHSNDNPVEKTEDLFMNNEVSSKINENLQANSAFSFPNNFSNNFSNFGFFSSNNAPNTFSSNFSNNFSSNFSFFESKPKAEENENVIVNQDPEENKIAKNHDIDDIFGEEDSNNLKGETHVNDEPKSPIFEEDVSEDKNELNDSSHSQGKKNHVTLIHLFKLRSV